MKWDESEHKSLAIVHPSGAVARQQSLSPSIEGAEFRGQVGPSFSAASGRRCLHRQVPLDVSVTAQKHNKREDEQALLCCCRLRHFRI